MKNYNSEYYDRYKLNIADNSVKNGEVDQQAQISLLKVHTRSWLISEIKMNIHRDSPVNMLSLWQ